jgi:hypothetical protein
LRRKSAKSGTVWHFVSDSDSDSNSLSTFATRDSTPVRDTEVLNRTTSFPSYLSDRRTGSKGFDPTRKREFVLLLTSIDAKNMPSRETQRSMINDE